MAGNHYTRCFAGSGGETLETLTTALVKLLEAQPPLMEVVPATGYIGRVISTMAKVGGAGQKPGLLVIHQLSRSSACAEALAKCDTAGTTFHPQLTRMLDNSEKKANFT